MYMAITFNIVKMKIESMKTHHFSLRVVGLRRFREEQKEEGVVIKREGYVDVDATTIAFAKYTSHDPVLSQADIVVLMTGRHTAIWYGEEKHLVGGMAFDEAVCDPDFKIAVVEDFGGIYAASNLIPHEMAHVLGAQHDGPGNKYPDCPLYGHIMAPNENADSAHSFSKCSEKNIEEYLSTLSDEEYCKCIRVNEGQDFLRVQRHIAPSISPLMFCRKVEGDDVMTAEIKDCKIHCYVLHSTGKKIKIRAAPYGFWCGPGKVCLFGQCVHCRDIKGMEPWTDCETY
ncbi:A disintegrin and metalloproteinase with thrombospondin motifs like [Haemaphysalis longicornis]